MDILHEDLCIYMIVCCLVFLELEMLQTKVVEKIKTCIVCSVPLNRKLCHLWDDVEKYGRARQVTIGDMILCMRFACWVTKATDTLRIWNACCFSAVTVVAFISTLSFFIFPEKQFLTVSLICTTVAEGKSWGHTRMQAGWLHYAAAVLRQTLPHWHL